MIKIVQRNSKDLQITYKNKTTNQPVNMNGYTLSFVCNPLDKTNTTTISKRTQLLNDTNATNGIAIFSLSTSDTNIPAGTYQIQFELLNGSIRQTILQDNLTIIKNADSE